MGIKYVTEGKLDLDCSELNSTPTTITWFKDQDQVFVHNSGQHIHISKRQLIQLAKETDNIVKDLK